MRFICTVYLYSLFIQFNYTVYLYSLFSANSIRLLRYVKATLIKTTIQDVPGGICRT